MFEYGVWNTKINKVHRPSMSERQVDDLLKVHNENQEADGKKPYLVKIQRSVGEWVTPK